MASNRFAALILAAGSGTRMKSRVPKVLHALGGRPMISHVLDLVSALDAEKTFVVVGPGMKSLADQVSPTPTVLQPEQRGTGDAVRVADSALRGYDGDVLIVYGDTPLLTKETIARMLEARHAAANPAIIVLGFQPDDPAEYGRLVVAADGMLEQIVEYRDAGADERALPMCNSGVMVVDGSVLFDLVSELDDSNTKNELYLTDIVSLARRRGLGCGVIEGSEDELLGINTRDQLALAEAIYQDRLRDAALAAGVTLQAPDTVWLSADTKFGIDVVIEPNVFFGPGVKIGDNVTIRAFSHLEGAVVATGAVIGPYARLRHGAEIGAGAKVGNFVEVKNAVLGEGAKANHLAYLGDANVGAGANIGAGTITANYDGFKKSHTEIGAGASIGSNSVLVAPVTVGEGAIVGAGTVITQDVEANALSITRPEQKSISGWAIRKRERESGDADKKKE
jgi:bifunctional UDP-N-acetylglucosamine pyrophosphorylase/glucosamine-1-phosphate N-acetyltransferase